MTFTTDQPVVPRVVTLDALPWTDLDPTTSVKLIHFDEDTEQIVMMQRLRAGRTQGPHQHIGATETFIMSGRMRTPYGVVTGGTWLLEPAGAVHEMSEVLEDTISIVTWRGPLAQLTEEGDVAVVVNGRMMRDIIVAAQSRASSASTR